MRKDEACPSKYFRAKDYPDDWSQTVEIETARRETFQNGRDDRLVVYFVRMRSGLTVGVTVWDQLVEATGQDDTDNWKGHRVTLFRDWTTYKGNPVQCIRVRKPDEPAKKKPAAKDDKPDYNDSIEL